MILKHTTLIGVITLLAATACAAIMSYSWQRANVAGELGPPQDTFLQHAATLPVLTVAQTPDSLVPPRSGPTFNVKANDVDNFQKHFAIAASHMGWYTTKSDTTQITLIMPQGQLPLLDEAAKDPVAWATNPPEANSRPATTNPVKVNIPINRTEKVHTQAWGLGTLVSFLAGAIFLSAGVVFLVDGAVTAQRRRANARTT